MQIKSLEKLESKIIESLNVIDDLREENAILKKMQKPSISNEKMVMVKNKLNDIVKDISDFRKK